MANFQQDIEKLNNHNYSNWKYKVQLLLMKDNLFKKVIEGERPIPDGNSSQRLIAEWDAADSKAQAYIGLTVEDGQLIHIRNKNTAKEMWNTLKEYHEKNTLTNKVHLMRTICSLKLEEGGNAPHHITRMQELFLRLCDIGEESLSDKWSVAMLLSSLPRSYDPLITALETRPEKELTFAVVQEKVTAEYERKQHADGTYNSSEKLMKSVSGKEFKKNPLKCYFCKKSGHLKKDCRKYLSWKENQANKVNAVEHNECLFTFDIRTDGWILDSGATQHVTGDKDFFTSLDRSYADKIEVANGQLVNVIGKGTGKLLFTNQEGKVTPVELCNVLYAPKVVGNLISIRQLILSDFSVNFSKNFCEIMKNGKQIGFIHSTGNLYRLYEPHKIHALTEHNDNCIHTWHRKMGHRDPEAIKKMYSEGFLDDLNIVDCGIKMSCDTCMKGKLTRLPFPKQSSSESKYPLQLIHTDVCGPMQTMTPSGKRYMVTFIDDYSRYTHIYLLTHKYEVSDALKAYLTLVKNKFDRKVKLIRSDRGGEYLSTHLRKYLVNEGIQTQLTASYSPQQNGVAERKNRTLMEMARCMLIDAGLPNKFWGEAVVTANFIQNRVLTRQKKLTPYELWNGEKPSVKNFRVFGSKCFVHVPPQKRQKLDNTGIEMIFLGYDEQSKAYRCYNSVSRKVIISRDVRFTVEAQQEENCIFEKLKNDEAANSKVKILHQDIEVPEETDEESETLREPQIRVSQRSTKGIAPKRLIEECHIAENITEPKTYNEAICSKFKNEWLAAMQEEITSLEQNGTWELCNLPESRKPVGSKWVFKVKKNTDGSIQQFKARLVAQGFSQKYGEDYDQTFAPVVRQTTLRTLLSIAAKEQFTVHHFDVKTAFLNGELNETIYMKQPPGFNTDDSSKVCLLKKSIYGLKQAARVWNEAVHKVIVNADFQQSLVDPCLYSRESCDGFCYILIYVDDIIVASKTENEIRTVKSMLSEEFNIKDLGLIQQYLGIEVTKDSVGNFQLCQSDYIKKIAHDFGLSNAKPVNTPMDQNYEKSVSTNLLQDNSKYRQLIGRLLYISVNTRPDIAASVSILAQKVSTPSQEDWTQLKRVVKYLKSTADMKLKLSNIGIQENSALHAYVDANWAEDRTTRKSNSGYVFLLNGAVVSWCCRKQTCVSLSSTEAEYVALAEACQEALWMRQLLKDMNQVVTTATTIYEDNQGCLCLTKSGKFSNRTKHIDTKFHFVKDCVDKQLIECKYCPTDLMVADLLTKPLPPKRHSILRQKCNVV